MTSNNFKKLGQFLFIPKSKKCDALPAEVGMDSISPSVHHGKGQQSLVLL